MKPVFCNKQKYINTFVLYHLGTLRNQENQDSNLEPDIQNSEDKTSMYPSPT